MTARTRPTARADAGRRRRARCARPSARSARRSSTTPTCGCARRSRDDRRRVLRGAHAHARGARALAAGRALLPRAPRGARGGLLACARPFQRDRDRIVHSKAFRRLRHKTQVFVAPEGDHYRTRLTHTLEVTGISRTVARALALNEDLAEAIGLGHDLGHPPFGHIGEDVLDRCLRERFGGALPPLGAVAARRRRARARRPRPEPHRAGPRRHPQPLGPRRRAGDARGRDRAHHRPLRLPQPRHRRRGAGRRARRRRRCRREAIAVLGESGSARIDTLVHDLVEHSEARRRDRPGGARRRRR